jgi:hypothetical protein
MQGIAVPAESVNPEQFFAKTRRHISPENVAYGGGGTTQVSSSARPTSSPRSRCASSAP